MGDVIGIAFITPPILIWSKLPGKVRSAYRSAEMVLIFGSTFLVGQIVFLGWLPIILKIIPALSVYFPSSSGRVFVPDAI